jgi:hypothetical protein
MHPYRLIRPYVGRSPTVPHVLAGEMIEPPVSVPIAKPTSPAAVAAAGPADDPLEPRSGFHGLRVRPRNQRSPTASSPVDNVATKLNAGSVSIGISIYRMAS